MDLLFAFVAVFVYGVFVMFAGCPDAWSTPAFWIMLGIGITILFYRVAVLRRLK